MDGRATGVHFLSLGYLLRSSLLMTSLWRESPSNNSNFGILSPTFLMVLISTGTQAMRESKLIGKVSDSEPLCFWKISKTVARHSLWYHFLTFHKIQGKTGNKIILDINRRLRGKESILWISLPYPLEYQCSEKTQKMDQRWWSSFWKLAIMRVATLWSQVNHDNISPAASGLHFDDQLSSIWSL